jgi:hypothetical protein
MTDHQLCLEHIANNNELTLRFMQLVATNLPAVREQVDHLGHEHLRVDKEIEAEYLAAKEAKGQ